MVLPDETLEDLQIKGLFLLQKKDSFRFGMDAVLLSNFITAKPHQNVLDLGTGTGIISVLVAAKTDVKSITGLEIQSDIATMAQRSIDGNKLNNRITIKKGDQLLSGYGFESDQKFENYDIRKTSGIIYLDDTDK